jgi:hypothetical protein
MNPEKLVASRELSQEYARLMKEKGRELHESLFQWAEVNFSKSDQDYEWELHHKDLFPSNWHSKNHIPALTSGEIGELLPARIVIETLLHKREEKANLFYTKYDDDDSDCDGTNGEDCIRTKWTVECGREIIRDVSEADARLKMYNYLLANNLV